MNKKMKRSQFDWSEIQIHGWINRRNYREREKDIKEGWRRGKEEELREREILEREG